MNRVHVCAAVIRRDDTILLATRPDGCHLAGKWEFPGGKVHAGETLEDCIRREIDEELGLEVVSASHLETLEHKYPERCIVLHFMECIVMGDVVPVCHDGQTVAWFTPKEVMQLDLAPADRVFVEHQARSGQA